jgi:hypothetical protein
VVSTAENLKVCERIDVPFRRKKAVEKDEKDSRYFYREALLASKAASGVQRNGFLYTACQPLALKTCQTSIRTTKTFCWGSESMITTRKPPVF